MLKRSRTEQQQDIKTAPPYILSFAQAQAAALSALSCCSSPTLPSACALEARSTPHEPRSPTFALSSHYYTHSALWTPKRRRIDHDLMSRRRSDVPASGQGYPLQTREAPTPFRALGQPQEASSSSSSFCAGPSFDAATPRGLALFDMVPSTSSEPAKGHSPFSPRLFGPTDASSPITPTAPSNLDAVALSFPSRHARTPNSRGLSISIPEDGSAFQALQPPSAAPKAAAPALASQPPEQPAGQPLSTATPKSGRKRPARLTLAPPALEPSASRSAPNSPSMMPGAEPAAKTDVKDLSSALRGAPRRRPSMPFGPSG